MPRLILIHWNATEAAERAERLRAQGHTVEPCHHMGDNGQARAWRANPPDAFVIDLSRLPSHGRHIARWTREAKSTCVKPIVFVEGEGEPLAKTRAQLPDATYTTWRRIRNDLKRALAAPVREPARPSAAGYSGTPLPKKLGIKADSTLALLGAPPGFTDTLGALPDGVRVVTRAAGRARTIILFARTRSDLARRFSAAMTMMADGATLWIAWPKKTSGLQTDLAESAVREHGLAHGIVDYKVCAIDATWSGLAFAQRRAKT